MSIGDRVMSMVERELRKKPDIRSSELFEKAKKLDPELGSLSLRQFHAKYPLQARRRLKVGRNNKVGRSRKLVKGGRASSRPVEAERQRSAVRQALFSFAKDLAGAESQAEVVAVIARLDGYVDQALGKRAGT